MSGADNGGNVEEVAGTTNGGSQGDSARRKYFFVMGHTDFAGRKHFGGVKTCGGRKAVW